MRTKTPVIYIASSVTHASESYRKFVRDLKQELRLRTQAVVLEWMDKEPVEKLEGFFERDMKNISMSSHVVALVDMPSIGLGMEIKEALLKKKPLLCLAKEGAEISRLLLAAQLSYEFKIEHYSALQETVERVKRFIEA